MDRLIGNFEVRLGDGPTLGRTDPELLAQLPVSAQLLDQIDTAESLTEIIEAFTAAIIRLESSQR